MSTWRSLFEIFANVLKIKKMKKKSHVHKYSHPLLNALLKHLWHQLQPQVFWVWCDKLWSSSFAISSPHLSPLKLCQVGWEQIFRFLQKYLIGFKLSLWLGHSKTFTELSISHSCCVFRVIVLLEDKPSAQSVGLNALDWVFIKAISIFWCIELFFYSDESLSPCCWKTAPLHYFTVGLVLCRWWAELVPFKHDA